MIEIENVEIVGWEAAIRGMRNPMESWDKSDSHTQSCWDAKHSMWSTEYVVGKNDLDLMMRLARAGSVEAKYRRMIIVYMDINAPLYWWKEYDTYKVGTVANSCSTMHKIHSRDLAMSDFSTDKLTDIGKCLMLKTLTHINSARSYFVRTKDKKSWWQMIQLLPSSYNQKRTVMVNYEVLSHMYRDRKDHKLDEWRKFCDMMKNFPYAQIITLEDENADQN